VYYFVTLDLNNEDNTIIKLLDWLDYNGFNVRITDTDERKRGIEIDFTVEAMALVPITEQYLLFTGNSTYTPLVKKLDSLGKSVTICSTLLNQRMVGDTLRRSADNFIELDLLREIMEKESNDNHNHRTEPVPKANNAVIGADYAG
jgi:uncharacterized LabA/DUF88 family protein